MRDDDLRRKWRLTFGVDFNPPHFLGLLDEHGSLLGSGPQLLELDEHLAHGVDHVLRAGHVARAVEHVREVEHLRRAKKVRSELSGLVGLVGDVAVSCHEPSKP